MNYIEKIEDSYFNNFEISPHDVKYVLFNQQINDNEPEP